MILRGLNGLIHFTGVLTEGLKVKELEDELKVKFEILSRDQATQKYEKLVAIVNFCNDSERKSFVKLF